MTLFVPNTSTNAVAKDKECLGSGFLQMSPVDLTAMTEGFGTMLAAREVACQRLLLTAWEIEETKRFSSFLRHIQAGHERQLSRADEILQDIKSFFTQCCRADVESSQECLQAIQENESKTFQIITAQAKHVSNLLGRGVAESFLRFTGDPCSEGSYKGEYILDVSDVDSDESDD